MSGFKSVIGITGSLFMNSLRWSISTEITDERVYWELQLDMISVSVQTQLIVEEISRALVYGAAYLMSQ